MSIYTYALNIGGFRLQEFVTVLWDGPLADHKVVKLGTPQKLTGAATTTRCTFEFEDPSPGPGRVEFRTPDGGFRLKGAPEPKIRRDPSQNS